MKRLSVGESLAMAFEEVLTLENAAKARKSGQFHIVIKRNYEIDSLRLRKLELLDADNSPTTQLLNFWKNSEKDISWASLRLLTK
jgi:hypothetical protein